MTNHFATITQQRGEGQGQGRLSVRRVEDGGGALLPDKILIRLHFHKSVRGFRAGLHNMCHFRMRVVVS